MKKIYIFDTSVFLTNFNCIYSYEDSDIVIPLKVLDEIDGHKKRQDGVGVNARNTIRILDSLREKGNLHKGVSLGEEYGIVSVRDYNPDDLPPGFDLSSADNQIIGTAITENKKHDNKSVIVVSRDINMRVKCDALAIPCEDYSVEQLVDNTEDIYTGLKQHLVDDEIIDRFYSGDEIFLDEEEVKLYANQYIMLISSLNEKKTALARFMNYNSPLAKITERRNGTWGLRPRNKEQSFAIDLLMDPNIQVITMIGKAGCGKTLLAIAAGLEQTLENDKIYKKLVVSRPIQPLGNDIGFLPGTLEEKMSPWLMPIQDNLEFLFGSDKTTLEMLFENGTIEMEALTYIRGRSISNAFIIIDEAQNLSLHELKTIITRVGEGTKIILTGDVEQIDNVYLDATTNGLSYAIERFKDQELAGHVTLIKGERSKVATLAAKIL
jgi:PhoH-like ATPase